ncbi:MAG: S-layer homology domain-containing protein [Clostridia bacterium]|nr:S-layer homology domain-containing protein [Clostridia bacterium]
MKKKLILLTASLLALWLLALPAAAFDDIGDAATKSAAETLSTLGIIAGFEDGSYRPDLPLTRAQFAKMGVVCLGKEDSVTLYQGYTIFPDVRSGNWAAGYVNVAVRELKLLSGYPDGTFRPDQPITEAEAITIALRMLDYTESDLGSYWPNDYMLKAAEIGLTEGLEVVPTAEMSRGKAARLLQNLLVTDRKEGEVFSLGMGLTGTENVTLLATAETDLALAQGIVRVAMSGSASQLAVTNPLPASLVGSRGILLTGKDGRVAGFVPARYEVVAVTVKSRDADGVNTEAGGRILVPAGTEVVRGGEIATYKTAYLDLRQGTALYLHYDENGALSHLSTGGAAYESGDTYVLGRSWKNGENPLLDHYDLSLVEKAPIYKNGTRIDASSLAANDVVTYSAALEQFLVSDLRLTGRIDEAHPTRTRAQSISLLGHTFRLSDDREFDVDALGESAVTLLLAADGTVADIRPASALSAHMGGLVTALSADSATVELWSGHTVTAATAQDYSAAARPLLGCYADVSVSYDGKLMLRAPEYQGVGSDFSVAKMTVGTRRVSPDAAFYEYADQNAGFVQVEKEDVYGKTGLVSAKNVMYLKTDGAGVVRAMVLKNVTGDAYTYGVISEQETGVDDDGDPNPPQYTVTYDSTAGTGTVTEATLSGGRGVSLTVQGPYGGMAVGGKLLRSFARLEKAGTVKDDAFEGETGVRLNGRLLRMADDVQVYDKRGECFVTLAQARERFSSFELYTDLISGKVRVIAVS